MEPSLIRHVVAENLLLRLVRDRLSKDGTKVSRQWKKENWLHSNWNQNMDMENKDHHQKFHQTQPSFLKLNFWVGKLRIFPKKMMADWPNQLSKKVGQIIRTQGSTHQSRLVLGPGGAVRCEGPHRAAPEKFWNLRTAPHQDRKKWNYRTAPHQDQKFSGQVGPEPNIHGKSRTKRGQYHHSSINEPFKIKLFATNYDRSCTITSGT